MTAFPPVNPTYAGMTTTIFEEMSAAARAAGAINLGQGFPEMEEPRALLEAAAEAVLKGPNQYPPSPGLPELRAAVAAHYRRFQALDCGADNVLVTSGATEAIAATLLALISPGDEVVVLQPVYDAYRPLIERAGGTAKPVTLRPPGWRLPLDEVERAITPRTRAILLNNPSNPTGRVFDREELAGLAQLCIAHDLVAICDEVWEHVVFDGAAHVPMIGLPGMAGRTVKIGSAGKIFGLTGWKVGFVVAPAVLLEPIAKAHQFLTFTTPPSLQAAVARGLALDDAFFAGSLAALDHARRVLCEGLAAEGIAILPCQGTYFVIADFSAACPDGDGAALARTILREAGIATIPLSPFYIDGEAPAGLLRLCFAKPDAVLVEAAASLGAWKRRAVSAG